jgi:hypothetical protein
MYLVCNFLKKIYWIKDPTTNPTTESPNKFSPIPPDPLLKVNSTEYVMLLPNIYHINTNNIRDKEDGLEKVKASSSAWPFKSCKHRNWGTTQHLVCTNIKMIMLLTVIAIKTTAKT